MFGSIRLAWLDLYVGSGRVALRPLPITNHGLARCGSRDQNFTPANSGRMVGVSVARQIPVFSATHGDQAFLTCRRIVHVWTHLLKESTLRVKLANILIASVL